MQTVRGTIALAVVCGLLLGSTPTWGADDEPATGTTDDALSTPETGQPSTVSPGYLEWYSRPFRIDTREFAFTQKYYWHRLFHPTPRDKVIGTGVLAAAFSFWTHKDQLQSDMAQRDTPIEHEKTLKRIQKLGGGLFVPATALLMYVGGSAFRGYRAKETGFMLAESLLLTDLVTLGGRWVLAEDRPKYGGSLHPFHGVGGGISGHSATAASISGVLSRMYLQPDSDDGSASLAWKRVGKGFAYGLPVIVAFGRINDQQHYLYNTVLGLSIGFWSGHRVADAHGLYVEGAPPRWKPKAIVLLTDDRGSPGLGATWIF